MRIEEKGMLGNAVYEMLPDGGSCAIYDPHTPRYWYNYLWNEMGYCSQISQTGHGRSSFLNEKGEMCMLNGDSARFVYLRDDASGSSWNIGCGPMNEPVEDYRCVHALHCSTVSSRKCGIEASWRIFVPDDLYGEIWTLKIRNTGAETRTLSLFSVVSFSLDGFSHPRYYEMYRCIETMFDPELGGIFCRASHPFAPHRRYNGYLASSEPVYAFDGDLTAFCGPLSTVTNRDTSSSALFQRPRVVTEGMDCTGSNGTLFIPGAVLQHKLALEPGAEKEIQLVFGVAESIEEARKNAPGYLNHAAAEAACRAAALHYAEKYAGLSVLTPDPKINSVMNSWLKKQVDFCIVGKKGVRDNLQIAVALLSYRPEKAKEEILECLRHQFSDGHAVLTWYPLDDTRYSDQPFWIIWAVCQLVMETGDAGILNLRLPWQDGGEATVLEHVKAALHCLLADKGQNGLIRIYYADWNDALNIPEEEQAESVMLSEQFCLALREYERMMTWLDLPDDAAFACEIREAMKEAINRAAWDGEWYIRALARKENIGSCASHGSKIYLNAQTWAILGEVAEQERTTKVFRAIDSMERDFGFPLNDPPYMQYDPMAGRMSGMLPGLFENGGVYCHASAFKILADCQAGRGDQALNTLKKIMPDSELNPSSQSGAEPYVFTNCYSTHPGYYGRSYQSWTTGTSAWCLMGLYEGILGVRRDYSGLRIRPCLPAAWDRAEMTRRFRGSDYRFVIRRGRKKGITADGTAIIGDLLPDYRDQQEHLIEVVI